MSLFLWWSLWKYEKSFVKHSFCTFTEGDGIWVKQTNLRSRCIPADAEGPPARKRRTPPGPHPSWWSPFQRGPLSASDNGPWTTDHLKSMLVLCEVVSTHCELVLTGLNRLLQGLAADPGRFGPALFAQSHKATQFSKLLLCNVHNV